MHSWRLLSFLLFAAAAATEADVDVFEGKMAGSEPRFNSENRLRSPLTAAIENFIVVDDAGDCPNLDPFVFVESTSVS